MLSDRRARILEVVVREYVDSATPVGSRTIVRKYGLKASPATIRSEMVRLEEEGYLTQPHTSAGRIPSDMGYRHYVESLMKEEELPDEFKRTIRHQFYQVGPALEAWAQLAAAILARSVENLALVTAPHPARARLHRLELVKAGDVLALLVVVLQEGNLREETLALDRSRSQDELSRTAPTKIEARMRPTARMRARSEFCIGGILSHSGEDARCRMRDVVGCRKMSQAPAFI